MSLDSRQASKQAWSVEPTQEAINCGSLQRIADAVEKMAHCYGDLIDERDRYKQLYYAESSRLRSAERSISAYKGRLTRLKRRMGEQTWAKH